MGMAGCQPDESRNVMVSAAAAPERGVLSGMGGSSNHPWDPCLTGQEVEAFQAGILSDDDFDRISGHIAIDYFCGTGCQTCHERVHGTRRLTAP